MKSTARVHGRNGNPTLTVQQQMHAIDPSLWRDHLRTLATEEPSAFDAFLTGWRADLLADPVCTRRWTRKELKDLVLG